MHLTPITKPCPALAQTEGPLQFILQLLSLQTAIQTVVNLWQTIKTGSV